MITTNLRKASTVVAGAGLAFALVTGCSNSATDTATESAGAMTSAAGSAMSSMMPSSSAPMAMDSAMFGAGCADYAKANPSGPGSVDGMAMAPVATAAAANPLLKTLTQALSGQLNPKVNLVDTLNGGQFTVFAPVDDAFAKLPAATIETLKTDDAMLSKILTYHVVPGQLTPSQVAGTHKTVEGGEVTVTGSPEAGVKVNDSSVICGGVKTANATVYLIDTVLTPM